MSIFDVAGVEGLSEIVTDNFSSRHYIVYMKSGNNLTCRCLDREKLEKFQADYDVLFDYLLQKIDEGFVAVY